MSLTKRFQMTTASLSTIEINGVTYVPSDSITPLPSGNRERRFAQITRTVDSYNYHTIDAIDDDGRAWWVIARNDDAPEKWTELLPLPSREDRP